MCGMITLKDISLLRGTKQLLVDTDLVIHPGQHIGVIGRNGTGKSSLFKLLLGELHADTGTLNIPAAWRMSHMAQEVSSADRSAIDYVIDGDELLREIEREIAAAEAARKDNLLGELYHRMETIDGYNARVRAEQLLDGLGFKVAEMERPVNAFSGGWRIRLNLARALMTPADILLLDEPTNHLDMDATLWLEQWLKRFPGALLLISHDRDFLDNVTSTTVSLEQQQLTTYKGNYSAYEKQRAARMALQQAAFDKQQRIREHMESFVRRFKAKASKAKQAQSRLKALDRMQDIAPAHFDSPFTFSIPTASKHSQTLLSIDRAELGYSAEKSILKRVTLNLQHSARIGLLGPNGAGKSTLIKSIVGDLPLISGHSSYGEHCKIGYFAQYQLEALDVNASPVLHLQRLSPDATEQDLRNYLGSFNFHGDTATGTIANFSGGEKARLALAIVAWQKPNLLLLDEPTNHLDLEMRHALTVALQEFEGTVIVVSHDRHLLRNCVDQFYLVADGSASPFEGDLDDYHRWLTQYKLAQSQTNAPAASESKVANASVSAADKKQARKEAADQRARLAPLKKQIGKLEKQMEDAQAKLDALGELMNDTALYEASQKDRLKQLLSEQTQWKKVIDDCEEQWLGLTEELEALENA